MENFQKFELGFVVLILLFVFVLFFQANIGLTGFFAYDGSQHAPGDFIKENQIETENGSLIIHLDNYTLSRYAGTNSMLPFLDENSTGIGIKPISEEDISIGDIVTFERDNLVIIHRVVKIGNDDKGTYFVTRGDNNGADDGKVRFDEIKSVLIGILY